MPIVADAAVKIAADLSTFERELKGARDVRPLDVPVGADLDEFERDIKGVRKNKPIDVPVGADTDEFDADLRKLRTTREIEIPVDADTRQFKKKMRDAGDETEKLGTRMKSAMDPKKIFGALAAAASVGLALNFIKDATNAAAAFQDSVSAVGVIFGEEMIPQMEAWGESASANFGASKAEALEAANIIATLGKAAGLAGQDLVDFAQQMVQLGGDLASMYGGTTQDAINAVSAALRGEMEPIRRYGVILDDATLRQKAFEMGLISTTKNALTPQQKVLASQAAILSATSDAQGDFGRTAEGMANSQRILAADLANVTIEIGEKMIPIMLDLVNFIKDDAIPIVKDFLDLLGGETDVPIFEDVLGWDQAAFDESALAKFAAGFNRTWDGILGREDDVKAAADKIGVTYDGMRRRVDVVMNQFGIDYSAAIDHILSENQRVATATPLGQFVAENMGGTQPFDDAVEDLVDGLPQGMEEAKEEAVAVAKQTPGALGDSLRASLSDYQDDLDALTEMATKSVSDLAERQEIEGILASKELTDALNSDSTRTRLQAMDLVNDLVADYELIAPGALGAGELVNPALSRGMQSNLNLTTSAANAIVDAAGNPLVAMNAYPWGYQIGSELAAGMWDSMHLISDAAYEMANTVTKFGPAINSEPRWAGNPLRGITKWGGNIVETIAGGIFDNLGMARHAASMLSGSLVPGLGVMSMNAAGGGAVGGNTYHVELVDKLEVRTVEDIGYGLKKLGDIGVLPGSKR